MKKTMALVLSLCVMFMACACCVFAEGESYRVFVKDESGAPVPGVMVQFCSDTVCLYGTTGEDGIALFEQPAGSYTAHILKAPAGFLKDDTEYPAPEEPGLVTIVLEAESDEVIEAAGTGFRYVTPHSFRKLKGTLAWGAGWLSADVLHFRMQYYAVAPEQWNAYNDYCDACLDALDTDRPMPEAPDPAWMSGYEYDGLYEVFSVGAGLGEKDLLALLQNTYGLEADDFAWLERTGSDGDCSFYVGQLRTAEETEAARKEVIGAFYDELSALRADRDAFLSGLELSAPVRIRPLTAGSTISFETADLDGNPVSSAELFAGSDFTMLNLWATWCPPCRAELPELGAMAAEFEAQGCRIVGILHDAAESGKTELGKSILAEAGAAYLNLAAPADVDYVLPTDAIPMTVFVDSEGRLLAEPIVGARPDVYRATLAELLAVRG